MESSTCARKQSRGFLIILQVEPLLALERLGAFRIGELSQFKSDSKTNRCAVLMLAFSLPLKCIEIPGENEQCHCIYPY